jgi:hypothetical protein
MVELKMGILQISSGVGESCSFNLKLNILLINLPRTGHTARADHWLRSAYNVQNHSTSSFFSKYTIFLG